MQERVQRHREQELGPGQNLWDGAFGGAGPAAPGQVHIASGVYQDVTRAGQTVAEIREHHGLSLDVDPNSRAIVNGHEVGEDHVLAAGDVLMFTRRAGEKG
jgi:hypothetical protein